MNLLIEKGLNKNIIEDITKKRSLLLRDNAEEFLDLLDKNNVPLLVFSASLGDAITKYFENWNKLTKNMHVIANFFMFNVDGKITGYITRSFILLIKMKLR